MATQTSTSPVVTNTTNGTVTWYTNSTSPSAAEKQLQDAAAFIAQVQQNDGSEAPSVGPADIIAGISVGASVIGTIIQAGQFGLGIANTAATYQNLPKASSAAQPQQGVATIVFTNNSRMPLAYSGSKTIGCQLSQALSGLTTGQSGNMLLTRDKPIDGSSQASVIFQIGNGAQYNGNYASILISMLFNYDDSEQVWTLEMSVNGSAAYQFPAESTLASCSFVPFEGAYPVFSIYFAPVQTGSGSMQVMIYDNANS